MAYGVSVPFRGIVFFLVFNNDSSPVYCYLNVVVWLGDDAIGLILNCNSYDAG